MKTKGTKHDKYTNAPKYNNTVVIRLDNYQQLLLEEICHKFNTTKSAIIRLSLNQFIKSYNEHAD